MRSPWCGAAGAASRHPACERTARTQDRAGSRRTPQGLPHVELGLPEESLGFAWREADVLADVEDRTILAPPRDEHLTKDSGKLPADLLDVLTPGHVRSSDVELEHRRIEAVPASRQRDLDGVLAHVLDPGDVGDRAVFE